MLFYVHRINLRDASIGEYLSVLVITVFLGYIENQELSPFAVLLLLISKYCNQFKNILDASFIKITGIHNSVFLLISNMLILAYTTFFFCAAQVFIYFYFNKFYSLKYIVIFTVMNFFSILIGNLISIIKRFNDLKIINILSNIGFLLIFSTVSFFVISMTNYLALLTIIVITWIFQLVIIHRYDRS